MAAPTAGDSVIFKWACPSVTVEQLQRDETEGDREHCRHYKQISKEWRDLFYKLYIWLVIGIRIICTNKTICELLQTS